MGDFPALLNRVKRTIVRHGLLEKGDKVLVACSGGADSMALVHILKELTQEWGLKLAIGHFNHRLRRAASIDERFVIQTAGKLGLPVYVRREDIRSYANRAGLNVEEAGRERRYAFLRETACRIKADRIATAHTLTDQAETVLMRILRGSGLTGLGGIAPSVNGSIIRPLIEVERSQVEAYLRARRIPYREDETNRDIRYLRNRVRRRLIPYLQRHFEPRIVRQLGRLAEISRAEEQAWDAYCRVEAKQAILRKDGKMHLKAGRLSALPPASARRLVRFFLKAIKGDLRRISFSDVEAIRSLGEHKEAPLPGGLIFKRETDLISVWERTKPGLRYEYLWDGKRPLEIPEVGLSFARTTIKKGMTKRPPYNDGRRAILDADKIGFPLLVRNRKEGDRYRPLGSPGRKKLKELMRAKGIPAGERDRHPVFLSQGKIVWVLGLPVADDCKITPSTRRLLIVEKV